MQSLPPYALETPEFPFRALAALAGRTTLGGSREIVVATLLGARLTDAALGVHAVAQSLRRNRAAAARLWLGSLTLPAPARSALTRVIDATAGDDRGSLGDAWEGVLALVTPSLDVSARNELRRLTGRLKSAAA